MSDLISRSEVLELLYKIFDKYHMSTDKNTSVGKSFGTDVFKSVREMPTAYDVDKVVEELEKLNTFEQQQRDTILCRKWDYGTIKRAIEIVKQGGESDDVCEWKHKHPFGDFPSCKNVNSISRDRNWKYCPYCGKKIKIVGD